MSENLAIDLATGLATVPPLLSADLPGVGGRIKVELEDFEVEEIAAYEPSGEGDFLYLWVEKRDMGAEYFQRQVGQRLGIPSGEVGVAGLKDRRAVTRQWISVPAGVEPRLGELDAADLKVLKTSRHGNKLRTGHLHGNRFRILIRDAATLDNLPTILDRLRLLGLPNFYGLQRFGRDFETMQLGFGMLRGDKTVRPPRNPFLKKLSLSAAQSALFNHCLAVRMQDGLLWQVLPGDVMAKYPFGGMFVADDVAVEQERFDCREIVSAGPIFGRKTFASQGQAAERESATLGAFQMTHQSFAGFGKLLQGTRRHNLIYLDDLQAEIESIGVRLSFSLPAGSYATVLLREVMKCDTE